MAWRACCMCTRRHGGVGWGGVVASMVDCCACACGDTGSAPRRALATQHMPRGVSTPWPRCRPQQFKGAGGEKGGGGQWRCQVTTHRIVHTGSDNNACGRTYHRRTRAGRSSSRSRLSTTCHVQHTCRPCPQALPAVLPPPLPPHTTSASCGPHRCRHTLALSVLQAPSAEYELIDRCVQVRPARAYVMWCTWSAVPAGRCMCAPQLHIRDEEHS